MVGDAQAGLLQGAGKGFKQRRAAVVACASEGLRERGAGVMVGAEGGQVAIGCRDEHLYGTASSKGAGDGVGEGALAVQHQPQQRAPRQGDA
jgi:hypothetical protein